MKDWLITEFYNFLEITHRRKAIIMVPTIGMVLFLILDCFLNWNLQNYQNSLKPHSLIDITSVLINMYAKAEKVAFREMVIFGGFFWSIREYIKYRKKL